MSKQFRVAHRFHGGNDALGEWMEHTQVAPPADIPVEDHKVNTVSSRKKYCFLTEKIR